MWCSHPLRHYSVQLHIEVFNVVPSHWTSVCLICLCCHLVSDWFGDVKIRAQHLLRDWRSSSSWMFKFVISCCRLNLWLMRQHSLCNSHSLFCSVKLMDTNCASITTGGVNVFTLYCFFICCISFHCFCFYIKNPKFQYIWEQNIQVKAPAYNGHSLITTFASRF